MPGNPERYGVQPISPVPFIDKIIVYVEPRAPETSIAPGDPFDQMRYFGGLMFCQPTAAQPLLLAGTGQMMRPSTLRRYAREAGSAKSTGADES